MTDSGSTGPEEPRPTHQPWGQDPYAAPPPYQSPYQQPQQPYYQQPYYQQPYQFAAPAAPQHPSATTALVLGIIALVGVLACGGVTLVLSPFAWSVGSRAVREIDENPGAYSGRELANAGRITGIIGTVLLALGVVAFIGFIALVASTSTT